MWAVIEEVVGGEIEANGRAHLLGESQAEESISRIVECARSAGRTVVFAPGEGRQKAAAQLHAHCILGGKTSIVGQSCRGAVRARRHVGREGADCRRLLVGEGILEGATQRTAAEAATMVHTELCVPHRKTRHIDVVDKRQSRQSVALGGGFGRSDAVEHAIVAHTARHLRAAF